MLLGKTMQGRKKLLLTVEEVAELTELPLDFWIFVAAGVGGTRVFDRFGDNNISEINALIQ